jgi:hypothetical protein
VRTFRCPVRDQIREKGILSEVRAYVATHGNDPKLTDWINDRDQCDQIATFVRFECEEYAVPAGKTLDEMPQKRGKIFPLFTQRNIVVRCPIHGEQLYLYIGHHITQPLTHR